MAAFVFDNDTAMFDFGTHLRPFACSPDAARPPRDRAGRNNYTCLRVSVITDACNPPEGTIVASVRAQMSKIYVACDLSAGSGREMLGTLNQGALTISEVRRFQNLPIKEKDSLQWDIPHLYQ